MKITFIATESEKSHLNSVGFVHPNAPPPPPPTLPSPTPWPSEKLKNKVYRSVYNILQCHIIANWTFYSTLHSWAGHEHWIIRWKFISICYAARTLTVPAFPHSVFAFALQCTKQEQPIKRCLLQIHCYLDSPGRKNKRKAYYNRIVRFAPVINSQRTAQWIPNINSLAKWIL